VGEQSRERDRHCRASRRSGRSADPRNDWPGPHGDNLGLQITGRAARPGDGSDGWQRYSIRPAEVWCFDKTLEAHRALEKLYADGKARVIGVSKFHDRPPHQAAGEGQRRPGRQPDRAAALLPTARRPGDDRPRHSDPAWSPIGGITFYRDGEHTSTLEDPAFARIAEAHAKSPAHVMLRWYIQEGRSVIPKSTKPHRIAENFDVFDFELTLANSL
jgi:aryl-alcohol dehydrogenase-like predicted oxidoreductase